MNHPTADEVDRDTISSAIDRPYVVVAGAGSGKTTHLVRRVAATIESGVDPTAVAVITFTDKAARELVHRLRVERIAGLDDVFIGTIHGFCATILRRYPIDAGLPPKFSTADEITSRTASSQRRRQMLQAIYDAAATDRPLLEAFDIVARHVGLGQLSTVVEVIDEQWHRFEHLHVEPAPFSSVAVLLDRYLCAFEDVAARVPGRSATLDKAIDYHRVIRNEPVTLAGVFSLKPHGLASVGGGAFKTDRASLTALHTALRSTASAIVIRRIVSAARDFVCAMAHQRISDGRLGYDDLLTMTERLLRSNGVVRAELRQRYQRIFVDEFQDTDAVQFAIIELLTDPDPDERGSAAPSPRLFAVGDPKQSIYGFRNADVELFAGLAERAHRRGHLAKLTANFRSRVSVAEWINSVMSQRFNEPACVSKAYQKTLASDGLWPLPAPTVHYEPLQAVRPAAGDDEPDPGPAVVVLGVDESGQPLCHQTSALAQEAEANDIAGLVQRVTDEGWRVLEAGERDVDGRTITWNSNAAKRSDIAVLVARRTGLATLESAFRTAGIPFRVEGGTLAYESREVYELLRVAKAIDNPADELMLVTALRTSILGCSDADLFAYRYRQPERWLGAWRLPPVPFEAPSPAALDDDDSAGVARVKTALSKIAGWSVLAHQMSPATLLATIYDWSMGVAAAQFEGASAQVETWRRVRFLIDEARSWTDEVGGTLHEYLTWVNDKVEAVDRTEIAPDERDEDSVRILTIHAAKGLEFPIVIVAALGAKDNFSEDSFKLAVVGDAAEFRLGSLRSSKYPGRDRIAAWAEEARLLYVAMTRAHDHLVLSCHTAPHATPNAAERLTPYIDLSATERWQAEPTSALRLAFDLADLQAVGDTRPVSTEELAPRPDRYRRLVWTPSALASRLRVVSSDGSGEGTFIEGSHAESSGEGEGEVDISNEAFTDMGGRVLRDNDDISADPGHRKDPPSGREVARSRGRYGTDIGIAVHEVMQVVDPRNPTEGFDDLVAIACDNVDLVGEARARVSRLARSLIASPLFARMMSSPMCEREVYVGTTVAAGVEPIALWGYIDVVFQCDDGTFAVVDFKTDSAAATPAELAQRYSVQLNAYGVAVEQVTAVPVSELWLLVADADGNAQQVRIERQVPAWPNVDRPIIDGPIIDRPIIDRPDPDGPTVDQPNVDLQGLAERSTTQDRPEQLTLL